VDNGKVIRRSVGLVLILYATVLGFCAAGRSGPFALPAPGALLDGSLRSAAASALVAMLATVAVFAPAGFMTVLVARRGGEASLGFSRGLLAMAGAIAVVAAVLLLWPGRAWQAADVITVILALTGCALGVWVGAAWTRGPQARRSLLWKVPAAAMLAAGGIGVLLALALEPEPLPAAADAITSDEKRRAYYAVRDANPRTVPRGRTKTLHLSGRELDVLASWAQEIAGKDWRAAVDLGDGSVKMSSSLPLKTAGRRRFLNTVVQARPAIAEGRLSLTLEELRAGRLRVPWPVLAVLSPVLAAAVRNDESLRPFVEATRSLEFRRSGVSITYGRVNAPPGYVAGMLGRGLTGDLDPESVRAHVRHLVAESRRIPPGETAVVGALRSAFAFARQRSRESSAVEENKASLLALGILLGHPRLQTVVGGVVKSQDWRAIGPSFRKARMQGRADWRRHFFVSAALTVLSAESVSDAAGLFKEELDADGGSGFSFADLLADRSGTCFALAATRDEAAARAMQEKVVAGLRIEDLFPPAGDLPERITDEELLRDYGGVGGARYRQVTDMIERRMGACEP
jgi:hypothetical protein